MPSNPSRRLSWPRIWRRICPHFCFACDRPTLLEHRHKVRPFEDMLRDGRRR